MDTDAKQVLVAILEMQKQQWAYLHRIHGWVISVAETIERQPELADELRRHPTYDQGPLPWLQTSGDAIRHIDALIQQLRG